MRKEVKDHGGGGRIAGALQPGDRVVITEDTVSRGVSMLEAAEAVREFATLSRHDPFDRAILGQARVEGLRFVTADARLLALGLGFVDDARL